MQNILRIGGLVLVLGALLTTAHCQKKIAPTAFNEDLEQLQLVLEKYYPGLYFYEHPEQVADRINSLRAEEDSITIQQAYQRIAYALSEMQDLHLGVGLPRGYMSKDDRVFPLILRKFGADFFVHYNRSHDSTLVRGTQIHRINGRAPIDDFKQFTHLYGADYGNPYAKSYYAERNFGGLYVRWYGIQDSIEVVYSTPNTPSPSTVHLALPTSKEANQFLKKRYKNYLRENLTWEMIDSVSRTALLDISSFTGPKSWPKFTENKFKRKLKRSFKAIAAANVSHLILDLRGNGGGAVVNVSRLASYLLPEPFRMYDSVSVSRAGFRKIFKPHLVVPPLAGRIYLHRKNQDGYYRTYVNSGKRIQPARRYGYQKDLYVLMDGGSYSATTFTISLLKNHNRGIFVGTRPGGANWGSFAGQFYSTKLANSGIRINVPLMKLVHSSAGLTHSDFFVEPDYHVGQSFVDFLKRRDTPVEFVKELIAHE